MREYSLAAGFAETRCRLRNITYFRHEVHCMFCAGLRDKSKDTEGGVAAASCAGRHPCCVVASKSKDKASAAACVPSQFPCVQLIVVYDVPSTAATAADVDAAAAVVVGESSQLRQRQAVMHPDSLQATGPYSQVSDARR